ncbi:MAG TPA: glutamine synthetase III, partial [Clostridia bacterium]|nr:glutamine synthetase III [Clostridia bacterium]
ALYRESIMDRETADAMAHAMKNWAIEKGASHYSHWFIPLTGLSAEKHNSFISKEDELPLLRFSGSSLIKGETDGSSFPTGGLRATFEARGFTYWDISSFAFIRGHVLYIPSIFLSYKGDQLDLKSPLLRAVDSFNQRATELLHLLGEEKVKGVKPMIGLEQEYFLVKKEYFLQRPDLFYTGRTLIGSPPPKGQEFEDHYLGSIPTNVSKFMQDVNMELWRLGIFAQCEHNESAPSQFEIVSHQEIASLSIDQNIILMDILKEKAKEHGFVCLLHEKPYAGINGSGKHNNISFLTSEGINLLEPGDSPKENLRFLLFLGAFILATEKHATLLRLASSDPGNDERLGGFEAPPAIVSIYLGEHLHASLGEFFGEKTYSTNQKKQSLPQLADLPSDSTDRNRTSPIAFTGNKFEVRMLGSSRSAAMLNICLLAALAEELAQITRDLEKMACPEKEAYAYLTKKLSAVKHILYEGDNYSSLWYKKAQKRGLPILDNYVACIASLLSQKSVDMFSRSGVLSKKELEARSHILYTQYSHTLMAEAKTIQLMLNKDLLPALRKEILLRKNLSHIDPYFEKELNDALNLYKKTTYKNKELSIYLDQALKEGSEEKKALFFSTRVRSAIKELRSYTDQMEKLLPGDSYPYPDYGKMLYGL